MIKNGLITRALSGLVLLVVVVGMLLLSQYTCALLLGVISVGSLCEFFKMADLAGAKTQKGSSYVILVLLLVGSYLISANILDFKFLALMFVLFLVPFIIELYRNEKLPIFNISATLCGLIYCFLGAASLIYMSIDQQTMTYLPYMVLSYILLVWANDVGAYLVGISIGKHRLFERLSPKKSWEGFFGGLVCAVGVAVLLAHLQGFNLGLWAGLGFVIAVLGVLGDLVESMFKRSVGVKDSGAIMPGHGGFLDRFDALLLSAPFALLYFILFTNC